MEQNYKFSCDLCRENLKNNETIKYSCGHSFCFNCFPYIFFEMMQKQEITQHFLLQKNINNNNYICIICNKDSNNNLPFNEIMENYKNKTPAEEKPQLCESCEINPTANYCLGCLQNYCNECLFTYHKSNKKFIQHEIINLGMENQMMKKKNQWICDCPAKHPLEIFCLECKSAFCKYCILVNHKDHAQKSHLENSNDISFSDSETLLKNFNQDFKKFEENLLATIEKTLKVKNIEFIQKIDQIIDSLNVLKMKKIDKLNKINKTLEIQLFLMESCIKRITDEASNKINYDQLHPNKSFYISNLLRFLQKKPLLVDFNPKFNEKKYDVLQNIKISISEKLDPEENDYIDNFNEGWTLIHEKLILDDYLFKTNPIQLFKKQPVLIDSSSFSFSRYRSNVSATFMINDESFIVWPGGLNCKMWYPLYIYNLTLNKKEVFNEGSTSYFSFVAVYPTYNSYDNKKWLYTGDKDGILRVFEISIDKKFKEIYKINTNSGKGVLSAIIFDDKFHELDAIHVENEEFRSNTYAIICVNSISDPIRLYKLNFNGVEVIREFENPFSSKCCLNFHYDEINYKTNLFFGFSDSFIKIYDLKSKNWLEQSFLTQKDVLTIIFFKNKANETIIVYTEESNRITFANTHNGKIIKVLQIPHIYIIPDICEWGLSSEKYLILATHDRNSIQIMNFETFEVVYSDAKDDIKPTNILKAIKKDQITKEIKECIVCLEGCGVNSKITLYE